MWALLSSLPLSGEGDDFHQILRSLDIRCERQEDSEQCAIAKLSRLLAIQTIRTMGPVSVNSGESESSRPP
jgi:hypothetical protein